MKTLRRYFVVLVNCLIVQVLLILGKLQEKVVDLMNAVHKGNKVFRCRAAPLTWCTAASTSDRKGKVIGIKVKCQAPLK